MTEHLIRAGLDTLEQAIQTVILDPRIPKTLRTALGVYQDQRVVLNNRETTVMRAGQIEPAYPPETTSSSLEIIEIHIWRNDESFDWSVEINGQRHQQVTSEVMEALVECAVIFAETSLVRAFSQRLQ
jgi:hypothetical protein